MCTEYIKKNEVAIEFSTRGEHERSTLRMFIRLIGLDYKRARQSRQRVVAIQSTLCEVACEQNSHGLKIADVKTYRTVVSA